MNTIKKFGKNYLDSLTIKAKSQREEDPESICHILKLEHFNEYKARSKISQYSFDLGLILVSWLDNVQ